MGKLDFFKKLIKNLFDNMTPDEIGRGISATDEKYMLYQIINARYNTRKPTVLISNFTKADFFEKNATQRKRKRATVQKRWGAKLWGN